MEGGSILIYIKQYNKCFSIYYNININTILIHNNKVYIYNERKLGLWHLLNLGLWPVMKLTSCVTLKKI